MSQPQDADDREAARKKLIGRAMVVGLLVLVAIYALATFWPH
jgi:hypothetical protein